jgi:hypothetical protein
MLAAISLVGAGQSTEDFKSPIGVWDLKGADDAGIGWIATIVVRREDNRFVGHIDWLGSDGTAGREYITWRYENATRVLRLEGARLKHGPDLALGSYMAKLAPDGMKLSGSWTSDDDSVIPGDWTASRILL